jgi:hypothetical protein
MNRLRWNQLERQEQTGAFRGQNPTFRKLRLLCNGNLPLIDVKMALSGIINTYYIR